MAAGRFATITIVNITKRLTFSNTHIIQIKKIIFPFYFHRLAGYI